MARCVTNTAHNHLSHFCVFAPEPWTWDYLVRLLRVRVLAVPMWVWFLEPDSSLKAWSPCLHSCHHVCSSLYPHVLIGIKNFLQSFLLDRGNPGYTASSTVNLGNVNSRFSFHENVYELSTEGIPWPLRTSFIHVHQLLGMGEHT